MTTLEQHAVGFARVLRSTGLAAPTDSVVTFVDALRAVGVQHPAAVYWAGRATLVRRPEDVAVYDAVFVSYWNASAVAPHADEAAQSVLEGADEVEVVLAVDADRPDDSEAHRQEPSRDPDEPPTLALRFSAVEVLRHKDFAEYTDTELREAEQLMTLLRIAGPQRPSFRLRPTQRRARPDLRATVRASLHAGGEPIDRRWRHNDVRPRRIVLLLDVSGSMEPYARGLLRFVHAAVSGRQRVEAFALGTRLTRMTSELRSRDPDEALSAASRRVLDWNGGTRLGDTLREFNDLWGVRGMARGAVVVVLSDGWDRGDPTMLADQLQRLRRVSHRLVWVNPLKVTPGYAPLARGMAAALPFVDEFVEGHSIDSMERLATVIAGSTTERRTSRGLGKDGRW